MTKLSWIKKCILFDKPSIRFVVTEWWWIWKKIKINKSPHRSLHWIDIWGNVCKCFNEFIIRFTFTIIHTVYRWWWKTSQLYFNLRHLFRWLFNAVFILNRWIRMISDLIERKNSYAPYHGIPQKYEGTFGMIEWSLMKEIVTFFVHVKLNLGVAHSWALRRLSVKHALSKLSKKKTALVTQYSAQEQFNLSQACGPIIIGSTTSIYQRIFNQCTLNLLLQFLDHSLCYNIRPLIDREFRLFLLMLSITDKSCNNDRHCKWFFLSQWFV